MIEFQNFDYVYAVITDEGWLNDELAQSTWPAAPLYGTYRLLAIDRPKAESLYAYLQSKGYEPVIGFQPEHKQPMLLDYEQAKEFTKLFTEEVENV